MPYQLNQILKIKIVYFFDIFTTHLEMVLYSNGIVQNTHFRCLLLAQQDRGTRCENKVKMRLLKVAFEGLRGKNGMKAFLMGIKS